MLRKVERIVGDQMNFFVIASLVGFVSKRVFKFLCYSSIKHTNCCFVIFDDILVVDD